MAEQLIEPEKKPDPAEAERQRQAEIKKRGAELKAEKDALNKQRADILAEQKALQVEKAKLAEASEFKKVWDTRLTDPNSFMTKAFSDKWRDQLAAATAGDATPLQIQQLREALEKEIAARQSEKSDNEKKAKDKEEADKKAKADAEEREYLDYANNLSSKWLDERKDKFPTTHATKMGQEIAKRVRGIFLSGGKVGEKEYEAGQMPNEEEIAAQVEAELDTVIESVYGTNKWSEKLAQKFKPPPPPVRKTEAPTFSVARKSISQEMASGTKPAEKPLTKEQKREMFAKMSNEEWNKKVTAAKSLRGTAGGGAAEEE